MRIYLEVAQEWVQGEHGEKKPVENEVLLRKLHERIEQLSEEGAEVRDMNQDVDMLRV